jgi:ketol-acid reductoisomerase
MAKMYYEKDCDLGKLDGKKIAIIVPVSELNTS